MFEKFLSADSGDFKQRYLNTYGFFTRKGVRTLVRLNKIATMNDTQKPFVDFIDRDGSTYHVSADIQDESTGFEFIPPKSSWYNTAEGTPYLVRRVPARQYLRGICNRNTAITNIGNNNIEIDFVSLAKIFEGSITTKEAMKLALLKEKAKERGQVGFALTQNFAVNLTVGTIKCFNVDIGSALYKDGVFNVALSNPSLWITEVQDAFRRADIKAEIK
jgi:hypothetical protein